MNKSFRTTNWGLTGSDLALSRALDEDFPDAWLPPDWRELSPHRLRNYKKAALACQLKRTKQQLLEVGHD